MRVAARDWHFCPPAIPWGLLEPDAVKAARPVLRGARHSNVPGLPGEWLEPSLMPRKAQPRKMGCWSGVKGLAAVERQAPAEHVPQSGRSTAVLGV
jgi:hypothetical protein